MKTVKAWIREQHTFHLTTEELIKQVQLEAYNSAVRNCWKNGTLCLNGKPIGKTYQTHSPAHGLTNIGIYEQSLLGLIQDE